MKEIFDLYIAKSGLCRVSNDGANMVSSGLGLFSLERIEAGSVLGRFEGTLCFGMPETTGYCIQLEYDIYIKCLVSKDCYMTKNEKHIKQL